MRGYVFKVWRSSWKLKLAVPPKRLAQHQNARHGAADFGRGRNTPEGRRAQRPIDGGIHNHSRGYGSGNRCDSNYPVLFAYACRCREGALGGVSHKCQETEERRNS